MWIKEVIKKALSTAWWITKIVVPTSLIVALLNYYGFITWIAGYTEPFFQLIGLPGHAAIVYLSSLFLPLYAPLAIMGTLELTLRDVSILSLMCLLAHSLPIECSVQQKCGLKWYESVPLRIVFSLLGGALLNFILPQSLVNETAHITKKMVFAQDLPTVLLNWAQSTSILILKLIVIVTVLMIFQQWLKEIGLWEKISKPLAPFMRFCGLKQSSAFIWLVAQIVGLTYGAGVMRAEIDSSTADVEELKRINRHIAMNHSLLEDTILFVAIGVGWLYIVVPRLVFALIVVWGRRLIDYLLMTKRRV